MLVTIILFILFLAVLDLLWKRHQDMKANIPGPTPLPIFGNIFRYLKFTPEEFITTISSELEHYGRTYRIWIFNRRICFTCEPEDFELILNSSKHIRKSYIYNIFKPWLKTGIFTSFGHKWFARRKIIAPTFHFSILEQFIEIFDQQSKILVEKLKVHVDNGKAFDIQPYISLAALDAVSETALGIKIKAQNNPECDYVRAIHGLSEILTWLLLHILYQPPIIFATLGYNIKKRHDKLINVLHSFTQKIISDRRKNFQQGLNIPKNNTGVDTDEDIGKRKRMAFLDVLFQAKIDGKHLSDDDIREEVDTVTFAGHDTITFGVCFTLYSISRHPEIQKKVFEEIQQVFGNDKDISVTYKDLQQLKYTELVIKESLRMYPPAPFIGREIGEDVKINGKLFTAGIKVAIILLAVMRTPKYFPNPDKFIPERHSVENSADTLNPYAFIPFSAGPRNCIGQKYAMLEMKAMITKILRHYELTPIGEDVKPFVNITLQSRTGYQIGLKSRVYD